MMATVEQIMRDDGHLLLTRLIRYIEERRQNESRFTGAIESDPSPLHVVWGMDDPIAVPVHGRHPARSPSRRHRGPARRRGPLSDGRGAGVVSRRRTGRSARVNLDDAQWASSWIVVTPGLLPARLILVTVAPGPR